MHHALLLAAAGALLMGCARTRGTATAEPQLGPTSHDLTRGIVLQNFGHIALGVRFVHRDGLTDSIAPGEHRLRPGIWVGVDEATVRVSPHDEVISITTLHPRAQTFEALEAELRRQHGEPASSDSLSNGGRTLTWIDADTRLELVLAGGAIGAADGAPADRVRIILTDRRLAALHPERAPRSAAGSPR